MSEDATAPEAAEPEAPAGAYEFEPEVPEGGVQGDHPRDPVAPAGHVEAVLAKEELIRRELLNEISHRRSQNDVNILVAACEALLDHLGL